MNELVAVDISHHNTIIEGDGRDAIEAGIIAVIHKATEGTSMIDGNYADRRDRALSMGLRWASYHFIRPGDPKQQAHHYLQTALPRFGERVVCDYEDPDVSLDDVKAFCAEILKIDPTLQMTIYGGSLLKEQLGIERDEQLAEYALWIAHYTSAEAPVWPQGTWPVWSLWQYSDGSVGGDPKTIDGISGPIDCNAFNGSRESCEAWFGPALAPPEDRPEVSVTIEATAGVDVIVTVNGQVMF